MRETSLLHPGVACFFSSRDIIRIANFGKKDRKRVGGCEKGVSTDMTFPRPLQAIIITTDATSNKHMLGVWLFACTVYLCAQVESFL